MVELMPAPAKPARRLRGGILRRFVQRKTPLVGVAIFVAILLFAFVGPMLWPYTYDVYTDENSSPPTWTHPFGTDGVGFDTMSQVMRGTQRSLQVALFVGIVATIIGSLVGAIAGFFGGVIDNLMMRGVDIVLMFPTIAVAAFLSKRIDAGRDSWIVVGIVLALLAWPIVARVVRSDVLVLTQLDFVAAARGAGSSDLSIVVRHLIPNAAGSISVAVTIITATAILAETALSYLGFGVQPPDTSLGVLISDAQTAAQTRPWLFYFPGFFIIMIALSVSLIGDGFRYALDPRQSAGAGANS
jgi:peptide/nickel transport system permease protein